MKYLNVLILALLVCSTIVESKRGFRPNIDLRRPVIRHDESVAGNYQYQWFTQRVDHFNELNQDTFQQRYLINSAFYKPGGPVFYLINGEGPMAVNSLDPNSLQAAVWAQDFNALLITLEHRYYGASFVTPDLSNENLVYLNSDQALADFAAFRQYVNQLYSLPAGTKYATFGGSYAGFMNSVFRTKYPNLVDFAVASSGPVNAVVDFSQYLEVVQNSLLTTVNGAECVANIATATQKIQDMLTQENYGGLNQMFDLCPPMENQYDIATFMSSLAGNFMGVVQYNDEVSNDPDIHTLCATMTNSSNDPLANYIQIWNQFAEGECVDVSYQSMVEEMQNVTNDATVIGGRMWTYQVCTSYGYLQTSDSPNQPFGNLFGLQYNLQQCADIFGINFEPNVNWTNTNYGGLNPAGTNILYVNGHIDPWSSLGVTTHPWNSPTPSLFINGTAHCQDMLPYQEGISPSTLIPAQETIKSWIELMLNQ